MDQILPLSVPGEISNKDRQKEWIKTAYLRIQADDSKKAGPPPKGARRLSLAPESHQAGWVNNVMQTVQNGCLEG